MLRLILLYNLLLYTLYLYVVDFILLKQWVLFYTHTHYGMYR
jgi:hypothetical protein